MILNICSEFPDMYIMMAVMGSCLTGARATSHAFLSFKVSISAVVGGARTVAVLDEEDCCFLFPDAAVNPGGSGMLADFDFAVGGELRSRTHFGGGGAAIFDSSLPIPRILCDGTIRSLSLS